MLKPRRCLMVLDVFSVLFCLLCLSVVNATWFCKDPQCADPISRGRTTYPYNPSADAVKNGYLPANAEQDVTVYKLASDPFILEVELNGKRGYLPRPLVIVTEEFIGENDFVTIEGPPVPHETAPYVQKVDAGAEIPDPAEKPPEPSAAAESDEPVHRSKNVEKERSTEEKSDVVAEDDEEVAEEESVKADGDAGETGDVEDSGKRVEDKSDVEVGKDKPASRDEKAPTGEENDGPAEDDAAPKERGKEVSVKTEADPEKSPQTRSTDAQTDQPSSEKHAKSGARSSPPDENEVLPEKGVDADADEEVPQVKPLDVAVASDVPDDATAKSAEDVDREDAVGKHESEDYCHPEKAEADSSSAKTVEKSTPEKVADAEKTDAGVGSGKTAGVGKSENADEGGDAKSDSDTKPHQPAEKKVEEDSGKGHTDTKKVYKEESVTASATPTLPLSTLIRPPSPNTEKPLESATVSPTPSVKDVPATATPSTVVIQKPAETPKMPEPKVTFQDPQRMQFGNMPQYDVGQPKPVFTTKAHNRFHDHHHHHHGAHGHSHDHAHDHSHDHDHHHGPRDHDHSHEETPPHKVEQKLDTSVESVNKTKTELGSQKPHTLSHDDHHHHEHDHKHSEIVVQKPSESGNAPALEVLTKPSLSHSHDGHHDHDHDHDHNHKLSIAGKPSKPGNEVADPKLSEALAPNANITFVPPEDATRPPVNYTQLVQDRIEGKTEPGYLNDAMDKEPSAGFPIPPPLDPATATEAPRIPSLSDKSLPASEMEAAIASNDRYNQGRGRARFLREGEKLRGGANALPEGSGRPALPESSGHSHDRDHEHHHPHDDARHDHDHSHELNHVHDHHDHDHVHEEPKPALAEKTEMPLTGSCAARKSGEVTAEVPCEHVLPISEPEVATQVPAPEVVVVDKQHEPAAGLQAHVQHAVFATARVWMQLVHWFEENISGSLRLSGMILAAVASVVFMLAAQSDRHIRRDIERGFEEYDHKRETELLALRDQVEMLLKQKGEMGTSKPVAPPPPMIPPVPGLLPRGPCPECEATRGSVQQLQSAIGKNESTLKEQRDDNARLLSRNNEVTTELLLTTKARDDLKRELESTRQKLIDLERRSAINNPQDPQRDSEFSALRHRIEQLEAENSFLRSQSQQSFAAPVENTEQLFLLQAERDESQSNVRLLRQLLGEKEEEIRKIRAAEAAGGTGNARELQEKSDEIRSCRKQINRLHDEIDALKRDRESQVQLRSQSFRLAADKAQRDALMARQETLVVRQQLEELCRKYGEQIPVVVIPQLSNGAGTPPGLMSGSPLMFPGTMPFPPGAPPTFEAFKQQVLSQGSSSGYTSPGRDDSFRREKTGTKRRETQGVARNGKNASYEDSSDVEKEKKRDRSKR